MANWSLLGRPAEVKGFLFISRPAGPSDPVRDREGSLLFFGPGPSFPSGRRPFPGPPLLRLCPALPGAVFHWSSGQARASAAVPGYRPTGRLQDRPSRSNGRDLAGAAPVPLLDVRLSTGPVRPPLDQLVALPPSARPSVSFVESHRPTTPTNWSPAVPPLCPEPAGCSPTPFHLQASTTGSAPPIGVPPAPVLTWNSGYEVSPLATDQLVVSRDRPAVPAHVQISPSPPTVPLRFDQLVAVPRRGGTENPLQVLRSVADDQLVAPQDRRPSRPVPFQANWSLDLDHRPSNGP